MVVYMVFKNETRQSCPKATILWLQATFTVWIFVQHSLCGFLCICSVVPNCVIKAKSVRTRVFVSDEIEDCKDLSGLYYLLAFQKVKHY